MDMEELFDMEDMLDIVDMVDKGTRGKEWI